MSYLFKYEKLVWKKYSIVAGVDEVGRGAFAGPVVAGAVVFDQKQRLKIKNQIYNSKIKIDDSKKLTAREREYSNLWIKENALMWGIGEASVAEINNLGILKAAFKAFRRALKNANKMRSLKVEFLLSDAFYVPRVKGLPTTKRSEIQIPNSKKEDNFLYNNSRQLAIIKGDQKSFSIAAASIIAKVYRDDLMTTLSQKKLLSVYSWQYNKGYGTKNHQEALRTYGSTKYHRRQFVKNLFTQILDP